MPKPVWFLIAAFFPKPLPTPCLMYWFYSVSGGSWVSVVSKPSSRGQGSEQGLVSTAHPSGGQYSCLSPPAVRKGQPGQSLVSSGPLWVRRWALMGELAAGPERHSQLPWALSPTQLPWAVFPACHHSQLPKRQSKATVTRSRGERLQLRGCCWPHRPVEQQRDSFQGRGGSVPSSCSLCLDSCQSPFPWLAFVSGLLPF